MIVIRETAERDLLAIEAYYLSKSDQAMVSVAADINEAFETLDTFPNCGRDTGSGELRFVSKRYRFVITYKSIDKVAHIFGIYRFQNRT